MNLRNIRKIEKESIRVNIYPAELKITVNNPDVIIEYPIINKKFAQIDLSKLNENDTSASLNVIIYCNDKIIYTESNEVKLKRRIKLKLEELNK
jgi:hypothetical protein